jgi:hypothetical protein
VGASSYALGVHLAERTVWVEFLRDELGDDLELCAVSSGHVIGQRWDLWPGMHPLSELGATWWQILASMGTGRQAGKQAPISWLVQVACDT